MDSIRDPLASAEGGPERVAHLEPAHWKRLSTATSLDEVCAAWAALQCALIPGATCALVFIADGGALRLVGAWPEGADSAPLAGVVEHARETRKGVAQPVTDAGPARARPACHLGFPLLVEGQPAGVVALELASVAEPAIRAAMRQVQWGAAWIRERLVRDDAKRASGRLSRVSGVLDMLAVTAEQPRFVAACRAVATEAALRFGCDRVSVGLVRGRRARVVAISHSAQFGKHMNLVRLLGAAMDEAIDQHAVLLHPAPAEETNVTRAQADLAARHSSVLTCPMFLEDRFIGALTFERPADRPFDPDTIAAADATAAAIAPILRDKQENDRWLIDRAARSVGSAIARLAGPGHAARKLTAAAAVALAALFYLWTDLYRVTADAVIEGRVQRAVVASFNGFVREAPVRAGDLVTEGQLVAALDDRELALERLRWVTERQRRVIEYDRALSERNRAETRALASLIEQADAQIRLVDEQLARTRLLAPFNGLIVTGDLTQAIGAAVQRGQVLFAIAPLDDYRVVLLVDESQIADITEGGAGTLVVTSLPSQPFPVTVTRITPVSSAKDGRNVFRAEASLGASAPELRPGMKGVAKIDVDERRVIWIWTRAFQTWVRLFLWRWFG